MRDRFPFIPLDDRSRDLDANPGVRLFGRRFHSDQTSLELLVEFLLLATSRKRMGGNNFDSPLPSSEILKQKWTNTLDYAPCARLNLKLFAFFGASKLETRHETHRSHLKQIDIALRNRMSISDDTPENVIRTLENLFLGFHGIGIQRTWCAQSFMPICAGMLASETIWNEAYASRNRPDSWDDLSAQYTSYFSANKHRFLARGGEVIYLQLCNALGRESDEVLKWLKTSGLSTFLTNNERNPALLHSELALNLSNLMTEAPATISELAQFIDQGIEGETAQRTDRDGRHPRWTQCGWCPEETWPESYLFAVEFLRVCRARLDLIDRLELLETLCALQVMRTLTTQAARYSHTGEASPWPACRFAISDPEGSNVTVKQVSRATVQKASKTIYDGLRHPDILEGTPPNELDKLYAEADRRYGHKLFITLGKRIGMIVPRRGAGMRFVLNVRLLRLLIIALSPGRRMTYETFKRAAEAHFGFAFDEDALGRTNEWATGVRIESFGGPTDEWLAGMLEEAGALRRLSDSCALVENAAAAPENQEQLP
jgi:hypothetical protein